MPHPGTVPRSPPCHLPATCLQRMELLVGRLSFPNNTGRRQSPPSSPGQGRAACLQPCFWGSDCAPQDRVLPASVSSADAFFPTSFRRFRASPLSDHRLQVHSSRNISAWGRSSGNSRGEAGPAPGGPRLGQRRATTCLPEPARPPALGTWPRFVSSPGECLDTLRPLHDLLMK